MILIILRQRLSRRLLKKQLAIVQREKIDIEETIQQQEQQQADAKAKETEISNRIREKVELLESMKQKNEEERGEAAQMIEILTQQRDELKTSISNAEQAKASRESERHELAGEIEQLMAGKFQPQREKSLLSTMSRISNSSILLLKSKMMTPLEIQYCVLIASGVNVDELCYVFDKKNQTVRRRRSDIRAYFDLTSSDNLDAFLVKLLLPYSED